MADELKREQRKRQEQETLVNQRNQNVTDAKNELTMYQTSTAQKLADLRRMSDKVYDLRVAERDATVVNQEYECTIRRLEGQRRLPFVGSTFLINREEP